MMIMKILLTFLFQFRNEKKVGWLALLLLLCPMGTQCAPVVDLLKSLYTETHTHAFLFKGVNKRREKERDEGCAAA